MILAAYTLLYRTGFVAGVGIDLPFIGKKQE